MLWFIYLYLLEYIKNGTRGHQIHLSHAITMRLWRDRECKVRIIKEEQKLVYKSEVTIIRETVQLANINRKITFSQRNYIHFYLKNYSRIATGFHFEPYPITYKAIVLHHLLNPNPWVDRPNPVLYSFLSYHDTMSHTDHLHFIQPVPASANNAHRGILWDKIRSLCLKTVTLIEFSSLFPNTRHRTSTLLTWCCHLI